MNKNVILYTLGAAMAAVAIIVALLLVLGARGGSGTAEAGLLPPPDNPPPNGQCIQISIITHTWKCVPDDPSLRFNRVDIFVAIAGQDPKVLEAAFKCQSTGEPAAGIFKGIKKDVNPEPFPNVEVWSGDFLEKCQEGVNVDFLPSDPGNPPQIKSVAFTNSSVPPTPTITSTPTPTAADTPTPPPKTSAEMSVTIDGIDDKLCEGAKGDQPKIEDRAGTRIDVCV